MRICPKCGTFYADPHLAFCLADGTPLANVKPGGERWNEGTRVIQEKAKRLSKQRRKLKWLRIVLGAMTALILTMVAVKSFTVETTGRKVFPSPSPTPFSSPSPSSSPSLSLSPSPSPSPSQSPSPSPSISPTPTPIPVYTISGVVTSAGQPLVGVYITLSGAKTEATKTDPNGRYAFSDLRAGGNYTVTPTRTQVIFAPASRSLNSLGKDESADFAADVFKISGRVTNKSQPLSGIKISLEGAKATSTATDDNGYYTFGDLRAGGTYTVTPRAQMKFKPPSRSFNNLRRDESADFTAETEVFKISGRVTSAGQPVGSIKISLEGSKAMSTTTDVSGYYAFGDLREGGSYTVTPTAQMKFKPPSRSFDNLRHDEPADFVSREQLDLYYKISGRVTDEKGPLVGVTIRLDGTKPDSTTTNAAGNYTFSNLPAGGTYTITTRAQMKFKPSKHSFDNLRHDESADFLGQRDECTEADQNSALKTLQSFEPHWRRQIESERAKIIKENVPNNIEFAEASLGDIEFQYSFPKPCKAAIVTARYAWQINIPGNAISPGKRKSVPRQKIVSCGKLVGVWACT